MPASLRATAALVVLATVLAGCGTPAVHPGYEPERPVEFRERWGEHVGNEVVWHLRVANGGSVDQTGLSLHMSVTFNNDRLPANTAETDMGTLPGNTTREYILKTPYRGFGDYTAAAQVRQGASTLAEDFAIFAECPAC